MPETVNDLLISCAKRFGDSRFIEIKKGLRTFRYSFKEVEELSSKAAASFLKKAKKGDRIAIWSPNSPEWAIAFFGALKAGLVVVPIDFRTTPATAEKFIKDTDAKIILISGLIKVSPSFFPKKIIIIENLLDDIFEISPLIPIKAQPEDLAEIIYTSGTTGVPKGVMLTHKNLMCAVNSMSESFPQKRDLKTLSILPLSHILEQTAGFLVPLAKGARIVYLRRINSATIIDGLNRNKITCLLAVPRFMALLLDSVERKIEKEKKTDSYKKAIALSKSLPFGLRKLVFRRLHNSFGGRLKYFICGGAPLDERICVAWETMGFCVYQGYGSTETSGLSTFNFEGAKRSAYCGTAAPGAKIKISDDSEVLVSGDCISPGYWNDATNTKKSFQNGWYKTGDIGVLEGEWLKLLGREKFRIVLSDGRKVYPEDIESKLSNHPDIIDSCIVPIRRNNEKLVYASIITKDRSISKIVDEVNKNLEPAQQIMNFGAWISEDFPRTRTLKVDRDLVQQTVQALEDKKPLKTPSVEKGESIEAIISRSARVPISKIKDSSNLVTDLKIDSLGRVELVSQIEEELGVMVDESKISASTTVSDLKRSIKESDSTIYKEHEYLGQTPVFVWVRWLLQTLIVFPYYNIFTHLKVHNKDNLKKAKEPCVYFVNHLGSLDLFVTLRVLGGRRTRNLVVTADSRAWKDVPYYAGLYEFVAGAVKIDREGKNLRQSLEYLGRKMDEGKSILVFAEGQTSPSGELLPFMKGAGMIAIEMGVQAVPLRTGKSYQEAFPFNTTWKAAIPHGFSDVHYSVGEPIRFPKGTTYEEATKIMEERMRALEHRH